MTFSLFGRKFKIGPSLAKNGPKLAIFGQNSPKSVFFAHIFKVTHQIFLIFLTKPWLYECKKMAVLLFCRKFKIGPFLTKNDQNLAIFGQKIPSFDLLLTPNFLIGYFLYEIVLVEYFFNIFVCYASHVTKFWPISGGRVV